VALAQEAADLAEQRDDRRQLAISLRYMGTGYMWLHEYEEAIRTYSRLLELHDNLPKDSILATVYNNVGVAHKILGDFDNALENYQKSLRIKEQLGDTLGIAKTYRNIGNIYVAMGRHAMALASMKEYLVLAQAAKDSNQIALALAGIGSLHKDLGNYDAALDYALQAVRIAERLGDQNGLSDAYRNLGVIYKDLGNYDDALSSCKRSLEINEDTNESMGITADLSNIAIIYKHMEQYDKALEYQERSLRMRQTLGDRIGVARCLVNIGNIYQRTGNYAEALKRHREALTLADEMGNAQTCLDALLNIAAACNSLGRYPEAERAAQRATSLGIEENLLETLQNSYHSLSVAYAGLGDHKKALDYFRLHTSTRDSIFNEESDKRISELQIRYETGKREKEIALLRKDAEIRGLELSQEKNLKRYLAAISVLVTLLAILAYNRYRFKANANKEITRKNQELGQAYQKMEEMARKDPLTGLSNRWDLLERIAYERTRSERSGARFSILIGDVDDFKAINDQHGHDCGDFVLVTLAKIMNSTVRKQDVVSRWGGEEFLILIPETDREGGAVVAEKLRKRIEEDPFVFRGTGIPVTMTFGVSACGGTDDVGCCITEADAALYQGKEQGKNCVIAA